MSAELIIALNQSDDIDSSIELGSDVAANCQGSKTTRQMIPTP